MVGDKLLLKLRVPELRAELAKRGCSKRGVKALLVERLQQSIFKETLREIEVSGVREETCWPSTTAAQRRRPELEVH